MVIVLIAATVISGLLGEYTDAITILIIVALNAVLGFVQEFRAERSIEALRELTAPEARVIRGGVEKKVPAAQLVPGDIILLEAGDRVPADIRLLEVVNLAVEESALTGESRPVSKRVEKMDERNLGPGDTFNMVYMGTLVTRGRARGIVVGIGMGTEIGRIAGMIREADVEETPLQRRLAQLGKWLIAFCLLICALVVILGVLQGIPWHRMFMAGVSLAVAAVPEGLPAIVTISLAIGVQRMIRRNSIIRRLPAVETLGCATVICSDKTGTLTQNKMTVRRFFVGGVEGEVTGEGYKPRGEFIFSSNEIQNTKEVKLFAKTAALCNNAVLKKDNVSIGGLFRGLTRGELAREWSVTGDPTEGALLVMAAKAGFWRERIETEEYRVAEIPFDSDRKRMSVVYRDKLGGQRLYVKGAPDVVLELCTYCYKGGKRVPLTAYEKKRILEKNSELAGKALRVLALAVRELPAGWRDYREEKVERELTFIGLAGMQDPPREAAVRAIRTCRQAGIKTVMITGDHQLTARAVGQEMGLLKEGDEILTGRQLDELPDDRLEKLCERVSVYARVSPKHKLRIVRALKRRGHVVAMTGDGVNDAPAVKEADIGIAMGRTGTDVTKEASAMVLADDNFKTIVGAVEEGRAIYDNIRKFIRYLLSCNVGEVLTMFLAVLFGLPLPLVPIQILWMNLVTDGLPAMALGIDPADRDIMRRPPRHPNEGVFSHGLARRIMGTGCLIGVGTLAVFILGYHLGGRQLELARTMAFSTLVFFQLFYVFACRSERHSILEVGIFTNMYLFVAVVISMILQLAVIYIPFLRGIFHTVPLNAEHWLFVLVVAATPTALGTSFAYLKGHVKEKTVYIKS